MKKSEIIKMERIFKGVANHWRIEILDCINRHNAICVEELSERLNCNYKTLSEHIRRLKLAGLIYKKYKGQRVEHSISPYGKKILETIKTFTYS